MAKRTTPEIQELRRVFPKAFTRPRPLKIGIVEDLWAAVEAGVLNLTGRQIRFALARWCNTSRYLMHMKQGTVRKDLDGNPAGVVSDGAEKKAQAELAHRKRLIEQYAKTKRARPGAKAQPGKRAAESRTREPAVGTGNRAF